MFLPETPRAHRRRGSLRIAFRAGRILPGDVHLLGPEDPDHADVVVAPAGAAIHSDQVVGVELARAAPVSDFPTRVPTTWT